MYGKWKQGRGMSGVRWKMDDVRWMMLFAIAIIFINLLASMRQYFY